MIFRNKNKYLMYKTMIKFNKCNSMPKTQEFIINKFKLDDYYFSYIISQCVEQHYIDGIVVSKSINNHHHTVYTQNIYITYYGYEFLKNYYSLIKKIIWQLLVIITTATITVNINNWLDTSKKTHDQKCQCNSNK